jgi:hypothetical protein
LRIKFSLQGNSLPPQTCDSPAHKGEGKAVVLLRLKGAVQQMTGANLTTLTRDEGKRPKRLADTIADARYRL